MMVWPRYSYCIMTPIVFIKCGYESRKDSQVLENISCHGRQWLMENHGDSSSTKLQIMPQYWQGGYWWTNMWMFSRGRHVVRTWTQLKTSGWFLPIPFLRTAENLVPFASLNPPLPNSNTPLIRVFYICSLTQLPVVSRVPFDAMAASIEKRVRLLFWTSGYIIKRSASLYIYIILLNYAKIQLYSIFIFC